MSLFMMPEHDDGSVDTLLRFATAADWLRSGHFEPEFSEHGGATASKLRIAGEIGSWVVPLHEQISITHDDGEHQDCVDARVLFPPTDDTTAKPELEVYWVADSGARHSTLANFAMAYFEPDERI